MSDEVFDEKQNSKHQTRSTSDGEVSPEGEPLLMKNSSNQPIIVDPLAAKPREEVEWIPEIEALRDQSAIQRAGCFSRLFFSWTKPFLKQAQRGQLHIDMFGVLREQDQVQSDVVQLQGHYQRYLDQGNKSPLFKATLRTFRGMVTVQIFLGFIFSCLSFASPFLVLKLTDFISEGDLDLPLTWSNVRDGVIYSGALCGTQLFAYCLSEHISYFNVLTGRRSSNAVIAFIYQKYSKISSATNKDFSSGQIVNFVQVDAQRLYWISYQISNVVQIPFIFLVAFGLSFYVFGLSFFSGIAVFLCAFVSNFFVGVQIRKIQKAVMKAKDGRMKATTEAMTNIKMIKLYSWQENFLQRIYRRRDIDVKALRRGGFAVAFLIFFIYLFPSMLPVTTFGTYIALGNYLQYQVAVAALVLFGLMRGPLIQAPLFFADLIQLLVSMKRIDKFLNSDEVQSNIKEQTIQSGSMGANDNSLELHGCFSWGFTSTNKKKKDQKMDEKKNGKKVEQAVEASKEDDDQELKKLQKFVTLKDIKMKIKKGEFVCIIGDVGSGKSSLLHSIIGDLIYLPQHVIDEFGGMEHEATQEEFDTLKARLFSPQLQVVDKPIKIKGSISYVSQSSWIQNKTIKDNILFENPLDEQRYKKTIKACELERDLDILPAGEFTEIGEKGINLSGGQKARVSLARAVYADSDIILMDDPISALDANVKKKIFKQVFQGMLKSKTRVLVTHAIDFLHLTDKIFVIKDGQIQAAGTYDELQSNVYLQEVLNINRKNMEESKKLQHSALEGSSMFLSNKDSQNQLMMKSSDSKNDSLLISNSEPDFRAGERVNNSTVVRSSQFSSSIRVTQPNMSSEIEEEKSSNSKAFQEPMLYRQVEKFEKQVHQSDDDSDSNDSDKQDNNETESLALDKVSEVEDMVLKETAAKKAGRIMNDEMNEIIKVELHSYKRYLKYAGGWKVAVAFNLILMAFISLQMAGNFYTQKWAFSDEQDQQDNFYFYMGVIYGVNIMAAIIILFRVILQVTAGLKVGFKLHNQLIACVFRAPINLFFDVTPIGKILNRFSKDQAVLDEQIYYNIGGFVVCVWQAAACLIVACIAVPYIIGVIVIFGGFAICLFCYAMKAYKDCYRIESVTMSPILSFMQETFNGSSTIRAFGKEAYFLDKSHQLVNRTTCANQITISVFGWYSLRLDFIVSTILIAGCASCVLLRSQVNPLYLSLMLQYLLTLQSYLKYSMTNFGEVERKMVATQRLFDLEKIPQEISGQPKVQDPQWPSSGQVKFIDASLRYRPNTELCLQNLSFEIQAGVKVGVVGRTGAGKSTMSLAMTRIVELCGGRIEIDGVNISEVDINQVREKITIIAQDPTLFTGTVRFNLDPFREHSNAAIEQLLIKAGLSDLLNREPESVGNEKEEEQKYQSELSSLKNTDDLDSSKRDRQEKKKKGKGIYFKISEGGQNLSAGEKQLICICRAILAKNKVVVLDEATANIDIVTEQKIQQMIEQEFVSSTVITIAHRINTIIKSDKVLVLSHGKVLEYDTPQILMENPDSHFSGLLQELKSKKKEDEQE